MSDLSDPNMSKVMSMAPSMLSPDSSISTVPSTSTNQPISSSDLTQIKPSLPRNPQSSSLLVQLPPEIRPMVLRYLLVQNRPIAMREDYKHPYLVHNPQRERDEKGRFIKQTRKMFIQGYHLTPSIIATCQLLSSEALELLYHKNTVMINIHLDRWDGAGMLHVPMPYRARFRGPRRHSVNVFDDKSILGFSSHRDGKTSESLRGIVKRFQKLSVTVTTTACTGRDATIDLRILQLRHILPIIAPVILASNVDVTFRVRDYNSGASLPLPSPDHQVRLAKCFMLLRCFNFRFTNLTFSNVLSVQDIITSNQLAVDLDDFARLPKDMLARFELWNTYIPRWNDTAMDYRLYQAIEDSDVKAFLQARLDVLRTNLKFAQKMTHVAPTWQAHWEDLHGLSHLNNICIFDCKVLGLELQNDGELNARLRDLAKHYHFVPVNNIDSLE